MKERAVPVIFKLNYLCSVYGLAQSKEIVLQSQLYPVASFVTWEKILSLSEPQSLLVQMDVLIPPSQDCRRTVFVKEVDKLQDKVQMLVRNVCMRPDSSCTSLSPSAIPNT